MYQGLFWGWLIGVVSASLLVVSFVSARGGLYVKGYDDGHEQGWHDGYRWCRQGRDEVGIDATEKPDP